MTKREELDNFILRADELIQSKYIIADIKIVNLLKAIACSDTLLALFKNCLSDFDYQNAKKKYLVKNPLSDDKGEYVSPTSSRELLAFTFNLLMEFDSKKIVLGAFLDKYFYEDGSTYGEYTAFLNTIIKPFRDAVKTLMDSVIEGKLQDPIEALTEEEAKREEERKKQEELAKNEKELSEKAYGKSVKEIKELLLLDKKKIKESNLKTLDKLELTLAVDMLGSVIDSCDRDAIEYAYLTYKYVAKAHKIMFFGRVKKIKKLLVDVVNEL